LDKSDFLYSDEGLVGEYGVSGTEIKTYGYKPSSTWTTDPLFMKVGNDYYFYENDHLGTPQKMTGINGAVVWSAKYKAFGEAEVEIFSTITNNLCFPGQYYDDETGLHYNFNRYYDYNLGFFLRIDPIGAQRSTNHIYVYSQSNPINNIDPKGLECTTNAECQTCIVYAEAGGTNETCRKAVAWVIQNRISDTKNTPFLNQHNSCDVASAPGEFDAHGTKRWRDCCNDCLTGLEEKASQEIEKMDLGTDDFMDITFFVDTTRRKFTPSWIEKRINNGRMSQVYIGGCTSFRFYKIE